MSGNFELAPAAKAAMPSPFRGDYPQVMAKCGGDRKAWPPGPNSGQPWRAVLTPELPGLRPIPLRAQYTAFLVCPKGPQFHPIWKDLDLKKVRRGSMVASCAGSGGHPHGGDS